MRRIYSRLALVSLLDPIPVAKACGGFFCAPLQPVVQAAEAIVVSVVDAGDNAMNVTMHVRILYEGPSNEFAWVLPLPAQPAVGFGSELLFTGLDQVSAPIFNLDVLDVSDTCGESLKDPPTCDFTNAADGGSGGLESTAKSIPEAVVLDQGSIGPYNFAVIQADDGSTAFQWLVDNGYDQPDESQELLEYYASMDMVFVALKLANDREAGEIQPVTLKFSLMGNATWNPIACVPIKLTKVAAADDLPVLVYVLGMARAVPVNYLELELDPTTVVDWVTCSNNARVGQGCFRASYTRQVQNELAMLNSRGMVTEYAGPAQPLLSNAIVLDVDMTAYNGLSASDFLQQLVQDNVPASGPVHVILNRAIPAVYSDAGVLCANQPNVYLPNMPWCHTLLREPKDFDATAVMAELDAAVWQPAVDAQTWINDPAHAYLTRLWGNFGTPDDMTHDPFFAQDDGTLPDVSNVYSATATPECRADNGEPAALNIVAEKDGIVSTTRIEAELVCGQWVKTDGGGLVITTARALVGQPFQGAPAQRLVPQSDGTYAEAEIVKLLDVLDSRVPNQTTPHLVTKDSSGGTSVVARPLWKSTALSSLAMFATVSLLY